MSKERIGEIKSSIMELGESERGEVLRFLTKLVGTPALDRSREFRLFIDISKRELGVAYRSQTTLKNLDKSLRVFRTVIGGTYRTGKVSTYR